MKQSDTPEPQFPTPATLCDADAAVLDALLDARAAGVATGPLPPGSAERAVKMRELLALLDQADDDTQTPDSYLNDLAARTLDAVAQQRQRQRFAQQVAIFAEPRQTMGISMRQVMTAAAVFLIGLSLLLPVLNKVDADAKRTACANGMGAVGAGFGSFASHNNGTMPRYQQQAPAWWRVGQGDAKRPVASNSANLYLLVRDNFIHPDLLNCPANDHAPASGTMTDRHFDFANHRAVSYSYQNQFRPQATRFEQAANVAVLADKNPLFVITPGSFAVRVDLTTAAPSVVHGKRGQNILFGNGAVTWTVRPVYQRPDGGGTDNIWTAKGVTTYTGTELPADDQDSFLVP